jgi:hypothetical protein
VWAGGRTTIAFGTRASAARVLLSAFVVQHHSHVQVKRSRRGGVQRLDLLARLLLHPPLRRAALAHRAHTPTLCATWCSHTRSLFITHIVAPAGILACLDGYMNIAMEQTEEYVDGQLKTKYGDAFIRGNNVLYISTQKRRS